MGSLWTKKRKKKRQRRSPAPLVEGGSVCRQLGMRIEDDGFTFQSVLSAGGSLSGYKPTTQRSSAASCLKPGTGVAVSRMRTQKGLPASD